MNLWAAFSLALPFRTPIAIWNIHGAYLFNANSALQAPLHSKHWVSVILLCSLKKCDWPFKVCTQCGVPKEMAAALAAIAVRPAPWVSQRLPERCVWLTQIAVNSFGNNYNNLQIWSALCSVGGRSVSKHISSSSRFLAGFIFLNNSL